VTVISSDRWIDADAQTAVKRAEWNKRQQRNWLAISTNSRFLIVPEADHLSLLSNKDHAHAVADVVVKMAVSRRHRWRLQPQQRLGQDVLATARHCSLFHRQPMLAAMRGERELAACRDFQRPRETQLGRVLRHRLSRRRPAPAAGSAPRSPASAAAARRCPRP